MTERELYQEHYKTSRDYKFYIRHEMTEKQIFEVKSGEYVVGCVNDGWRIWQASAKREGFVLVPLTRETAVAIEQKVEQQLEASGITAEPYRLDGWAILDAISAAEVQNGLD